MVRVTRCHMVLLHFPEHCIFLILQYSLYSPLFLLFKFWSGVFANSGISALLRISLLISIISAMRISFRFGSISEVFPIYTPLNEHPLIISNNA